MRLACSEDLYQLLLRVHDGRIVHHDVCDVHPCGFSWIGSDMSESYREQVGEALHAGLIRIGAHIDGASAVSLTPVGLERMREWRLRTVGGVA